jgi:endonuclease YncB( thermonuclease family)
MRRVRWRGRRAPQRLLSGLAVLAAIALLALVAGLLQPPGARLAGAATAVDGDTLRLGETRIRLVGLDAVELDQSCTGGDGARWDCGRAARAFLAGLAAGRQTACVAEGRDRYSRVLARCDGGEGDFGAAVVRAGWAVAEAEYALALAEARLNGRGIWAGRFDDPADWRRSHGDGGFDLWAWLLGLIGR